MGSQNLNNFSPHIKNAISLMPGGRARQLVKGILVLAGPFVFALLERQSLIRSKFITRGCMLRNQPKLELSYSLEKTYVW
jgi:hypothetical protein